MPLAPSALEGVHRCAQPLSWRKCVHVCKQPRLGEGCHSHVDPTPYHGRGLFIHVHSSPYWRKSVHTCTKLPLEDVGRFHVSTTPISKGGHSSMLLTRYCSRLYRHAHSSPPAQLAGVHACAQPPLMREAFAHAPPSLGQGRVFRHAQNHHLSQGGRWRMRPAPLSTGGASGVRLAPCQHVSRSPMHSATHQGGSTDVTIECNVL